MNFWSVAMLRKLSFGLFFIFHIYAQHPEDKRILDKLCSADFSGRGYVNQGDTKAADFLIEEFRKLGLKKVNRTYFQLFDFDVNTFPGKLELKINGEILVPGKDYVINPSSPYAILDRETKLFSDIFRSAEEIFSAIGEIDLMNQVLVLDKSHFKSRDELLVLRTTLTKLADIMPVIVLTDGSPIWHVSQNQWNYPVFEVDRSKFKEGRVEMIVEAKKIKHEAKNVIGRIPAKGKAMRRIIFTAHYDHLGQMGANTYYPGANDNASGVTLMMAIARKLLSQPKTSTEYVFIAFAGEEVGLLGSKYFVENPLIDLKSIRFLLNLDIFGGAHHSITAVNGTIHHDEFECLVKTNQEMGITGEIKVRGESANSDHHWFHAAGVKSFFLYSGGLNPHYHVPWDVAKDVDLVLLDKTADLLIKFASRL